MLGCACLTKRTYCTSADQAQCCDNYAELASKIAECTSLTASFSFQAAYVSTTTVTVPSLERPVKSGSVSGSSSRSASSTIGRSEFAMPGSYTKLLVSSGGAQLKPSCGIHSSLLFLPVLSSLTSRNPTLLYMS